MIIPFTIIWFSNESIFNDIFRISEMQKRATRRRAAVATISNHRDNRKVRFSPFYSDIM